MRRIVDLHAGRLMVVTDLHGDYAIYCRYRDHFLSLHSQGRADRLLFCGDLIHSDGPAEQDGSLQIILDLLRLKQALGEALLILLGNHELPHLYSITLTKGHTVYTPHFEAAMGSRRAEILAFFDSLPFYVRTQAGVSFSHAGASEAAASPERFKLLANYSHAAELAQADDLLNHHNRASLRAGLAKLNETTYDAMVLEYLGPGALTETRYDDLLRGVYVSSVSLAFDAVWEAMMNKNEKQYGLEAYQNYLMGTLTNLSRDGVPQQLIVSGHISVRGGHQVVAERQLRLASWHHAQPREAGEFLLFEAGETIERMSELEKRLGSILK